MSPTRSLSVSSVCSLPSLSLPVSSSTRKRTHTSLFPQLSPSFPPSLSPPSSPLLTFSIHHRAFLSGRVGGREGRSRGRVSGPLLSGDVPGSFSLVARSALVDLGVDGHSGPHGSEVPSERGAEGGVAKRQATAAGPRSMAVPAGAVSCGSPPHSPFVSSVCSLPSLSLSVSSSTRKRTHTSLFPQLSPSFPPSLSPPSSPLLTFSIHHRAFLSGRVGGREGRSRGRVSGPLLSGDVPSSFSLVARSALVDLGVDGHCGPHVSEVPSERGAEGGVAKTQATAAGPRSADQAEPTGAACVSPTRSVSVSSVGSLPSLSLPVSSSTRKRTHTSLFPHLSPSFPPSPLSSCFPYYHFLHSSYLAFFSGRLVGRETRGR